MNYNYLESIKEDIVENYEKERLTQQNYDELYEEMFIDDSITGNASGSYTFSTWQAEENLAHNLDLLKEALQEFCSDYDIMESPEACDVTIRCYLLGQALTEVIEEIEEEEEEED